MTSLTAGQELVSLDTGFISLVLATVVGVASGIMVTAMDLHHGQVTRYLHTISTHNIYTIYTIYTAAAAAGDGAGGHGRHRHALDPEG